MSYANYTLIIKKKKTQPRNTSLFVGIQSQVSGAPSLTQPRLLLRVLRGWHKFLERNPGWAEDRWQEAWGVRVQVRPIPRSPGEGLHAVIPVLVVLMRSDAQWASLSITH